MYRLEGQRTLYRLLDRQEWPGTHARECRLREGAETGLVHDTHERQHAEVSNSACL